MKTQLRPPAGPRRAARGRQGQCRDEQSRPLSHARGPASLLGVEDAMDNTAISDFLVEARRFLEPRWDEWRRERGRDLQPGAPVSRDMCRRSEEPTSELASLTRTSYA